MKRNIAPNHFDTVECVPILNSKTSYEIWGYKDGKKWWIGDSGKERCEVAAEILRTEGLQALVESKTFCVYCEYEGK